MDSQIDIIFKELATNLKKVLKVKHLKTGNIYYVYSLNVINCTNGENDKKMVLYYKDIKDYGRAFFVREFEEFKERFLLISELKKGC